MRHAERRANLNRRTLTNIYRNINTMIISGNSNIMEVEGISSLQKQRIIDFLQGAVYSWDKNRKDEWFALRDLLGGDNFFWEGTPLIELYYKHENILGDGEEAVQEAGKDAGMLLKEMLKSDGRKYDSKKEDGVNKYKWNGE